MSLFQLLITRSAQGTTSVEVTCHVGLTVWGRELENETAFLSPWTLFSPSFPTPKVLCSLVAARSNGYI